MCLRLLMLLVDMHLIRPDPNEISGSGSYPDQKIFFDPDPAGSQKARFETSLLSGKFRLIIAYFCHIVNITVNKNPLVTATIHFLSMGSATVGGAGGLGPPNFWEFPGKINVGVCTPTNFDRKTLGS